MWLASYTWWECLFPPCDPPSHLLTVSSDEQKLFLMSPKVLVVFLCGYDFSLSLFFFGVFKKIFSVLKERRWSWLFSSRSFLAFLLVFGSAIYMELFFMHNVTLYFNYPFSCLSPQLGCEERGKRMSIAPS